MSLQFEALNYLVEHQIPITSSPFVRIRIRQIEEVEFAKANTIDDNGVTEKQLNRVYNRLNKALSEPLPQHAEEIFKLWFPLDEDQIYIRGNQHLDALSPVYDQLIASSLSSSSLQSESSSSPELASNCSPPFHSLTSILTSPMPDPNPDVSPHIIQVYDDGNFTFMLIRTRKYNYAIAFSTS
jgi:hypothetical protein